MLSITVPFVGDVSDTLESIQKVLSTRSFRDTFDLVETIANPNVKNRTLL